MEELYAVIFGRGVMKDPVAIYSDDDLSYVYIGEKEDDVEHCWKLGIGHQHHYYKKDLSKIVDDLSWTIIIEDDESFIYKGQERNLLKVPRVEGEFDDAYRYRESYSSAQFIEKMLDFRYLNNIFYATGLLFSALEIVQKENKTLADVLFQLQFKEIENKYTSKWNWLFMELNYYEKGLKKLQEINPRLQFLTSENLLTLDVRYNVPSVVKSGVSHFSVLQDKLIASEKEEKCESKHRMTNY